MTLDFNKHFSRKGEIVMWAYIIAGLVVLFLIILIANIKIVPQANAYVVERLGAYSAT